MGFILTQEKMKIFLDSYESKAENDLKDPKYLKIKKAYDKKQKTVEIDAEK